jgi:hypothetical protein
MGMLSGSGQRHVGAGVVGKEDEVGGHEGNLHTVADGEIAGAQRAADDCDRAVVEPDLLFGA